MKLLITLSLLLMSTCCPYGVKSNDTRLVEEAASYCLCHGHIDRFVYGDASYDLKCRDGSGVSGQNTPMTAVHFYANCDQDS